jgi:hypothetical protein
MSNRRSAADSTAAKQQGLFDNGPAEGSLDLVLGLKQLLSRLLRGHDRYLVAAQIGKATLKEISKDSLDKVLSSDPAYHPSAILVVAICKITGSLEPFKYLLEPLDSDAIDPGDRDLIELARKQEKVRVLQQDIDIIRTRRGLK